MRSTLRGSVERSWPGLSDITQHSREHMARSYRLVRHEYHLPEVEVSKTSAMARSGALRTAGNPYHVKDK